MIHRAVGIEIERGQEQDRKILDLIVAQVAVLLLIDVHIINLADIEQDQGNLLFI